jgi:hypothetical protein
VWWPRSRPWRCHVGGGRGRGRGATELGGRGGGDGRGCGRWQPLPIGEAGAEAAWCSVAEVALLEAVAPRISARPGMHGSLPATAATAVR